MVSKSVNGWNLLTLDIPGDAALANGTDLEIGCENKGNSLMYFDDFRFQPLQATLTTYVYDSSTGALTCMLDNKNLFTRFEYDAGGRLIKTYRETFDYGVKLVSENTYHYARRIN